MSGEFEPVEKYFEKYSSSKNGLIKSQVQQNAKAHGTNELVEVKQESLLVAIGKELVAFFPLLLLISSGMSLFAHSVSPGEGYNFIAYALLFVVLLNSTVSLVQKRKVAAIMSSFAGYIPEEVVVVRSQKQQVISAREVVCGDVILLAEGDKIPADAIVIESHELQVDESILTGESVAAHKDVYEQNEKGILRSGTTILQGNCKALVIAVGKNTQFGEIAGLTQTVKQELTPMQEELAHFVKRISIIAITLGITFFLIGLLYLQNPFWTNLIFAIGIIVANVPEGLLPTVTLALTQASQKMAKKNAVVKSLESVETLGSCSVICTDKTGTLTQNQMKVVRTFTNLADISSSDTHAFVSNPASTPFLEIIATCNDASHVEKKHGVTQYVGDPTETALCDFCDIVASTQDLRANFSVQYEKTFNSKDKFMSKVLQTQAGTEYTTVKGAPEVVLERCDRIHLDGEATGISDEHKQAIHQQLESYEEEGLRVLALGYYTHGQEHDNPHNLVFVGLIALMDPPRPEVMDAVASCKQAGIRIIVISGDNQKTVAAIAKQTGIAKNPTCITGPQLEEMSDQELKELLTNNPELVFARTAPKQKLQIVTALQELGERVAVTGDGVNDAPALRKADIGVSMGKNGTDVAKDASDIILLDDNFATIVSAVKQGRAVFDNIKKFITYVLTSNIPEILPFLLYVVMYPNIPLPITVLQILTIDLLTDILPSIALGNERAETDVMSRKPREKTDRLVSIKTFMRSYAFIGVIEAIFAFSTFFMVLYMGGWSFGADVSPSLYMYATTTFLATIVLCQVGNVLACRTNRQSSFTKFSSKNSWLVWGIAVELLVVAGLYLLIHSGLDSVLKGYFGITEIGVVTAPLITSQWALIGAVMIAGPILLFFAEELRKYYARKGVAWLDV